jgi:hypothetical protein
LKTFLNPLAGLLMCALLVSCKKESSGGDGTHPPTGTYSFVSMQTNAVSTTSSTDGFHRTVHVKNYVTTYNAGSLTFAPSAMSSTNLSYHIDTFSVVSSYNNGVLEEKMAQPFFFSFLPTTAISNYKIITSDSLYFTSGTMLRDGLSTHLAEPIGAKIQREGDKLFMTIRTSDTSTRTIGEIIITDAFNAIATITLQKK